MAEPEELSADQVEELHADLVALQRSLSVALGAGAESSKPVALDQSSVGRLSRMDAMQVQQMAKASQRSNQLRLQRVAQALRLVDEDEYGLCRRCEEPVGYRRLKVRPETPFCVVCQEAVESR
jgi:DnaK suppressor protein